MASKQVDRPKVDPRDEPSAEWGWHGQFPAARQAFGWVVVGSLLVMLIGNHEGNIENFYLIGIAAALAGVLVHDLRKRRTSWRQ